MHQVRDTYGNTRQILRRSLYCGVGSIISVALAFAFDFLHLYRLQFQFWGVDIEGIIIRSLFSAIFCVSTVFALRKYRLLPLSIIVSLLIGLVTHKIGREFLWALYPSDNEVGFGALGIFLDQHYSLTFGLDAGSLVSDFFVVPLSALFCSSLSKNVRAIVGGIVAGLVIALVMLFLSFWFTEITMFTSRYALFIAFALSLLQVFFLGGILGGGIALGEYLANRPISQWLKTSSVTNES